MYISVQRESDMATRACTVSYLKLTLVHFTVTLRCGERLFKLGSISKFKLIIPKLNSVRYSGEHIVWAKSSELAL